MAHDHGKPEADKVTGEEVLGEFEGFLERVRQVSPATSECYGRHVRAFLSSTAGQMGLRALDGRVVRDYVTGLSGRYAPMSVRLRATSLRCFLRFAWVRGLTATDLSDAVGMVATHSAGRLPRALSADQLRELLAVPDRTSPAGTRDFAILLLLSRLGLRAGEVARFRLEDVDWRSGTLTARTKGARLLRLPVPLDVGEALVSYLRVRPASEHRQVFLTARGTPEPLTPGAVTQVVDRCARRAGLGVVHAHRLRHTAARQVLDAGGSLQEVGQLLGHATPQVTAMYSSMDLATLRFLARPWPEGALS